MDYQVPYTKRPEDILKLFDLLSAQPAPRGAVEVGTIKKWGFPPASAGHLLAILLKLGFIDSKNRASAVWQQYGAAENRAATLAIALKKAYQALFENFRCPYLEDYYSLSEFFKQTYKTSDKDADLLLQTFQRLADKADFQDLLCDEGNEVIAPPTVPALPEASIKVNPNMQLTIQIHIDPQTSDEKIEVIFKNMQKYLLKK